MKIEPREGTKAVRLVAARMGDRLLHRDYVNEIWISRVEVEGAMRIEPRERTKAVRLVASEIDDRLFIKDAAENEIWVSTSYGQIKVGVVGGQQYHLNEGQLVPGARISEPIEYQPAREVAEGADGE